MAAPKGGNDAAIACTGFASLYKKRFMYFCPHSPDKHTLATHPRKGRHPNLNDAYDIWRFKGIAWMMAKGRFQLP